MNTDRIRQIKEDIKERVKSQKRTFQTKNEVEVSIDEKVREKCDKLYEENKTSADIKDVIQNKLENDPVMAFATTRKMNQLDLQRNTNDLVYEIKIKEK